MAKSAQIKSINMKEQTNRVVVHDVMKAKVLGMFVVIAKLISCTLSNEMIYIYL